MKSNKFEAVFEAILMVVATIAFAYFAGESFASVGAQALPTDSALSGLTAEQKDQIREVYDEFSPGISEEDAIRNTESLIDSGYLTAGQATNPGEVREALGRAAEDYPEEENFLGSIFPNIVRSLAPAIPEISGSGFQNAILDPTGGLAICPETNEGEMCQQMTSNECETRCKTSCVEVIDSEGNSVDAEEVCMSGVCYDSNEGVCSWNSPKGLCYGDGIQWFEKDDREQENLCKNGCCILKNEGIFTTEKQCTDRIESLNLVPGENGIGFDASISTEPECIEEVIRIENEKKEGACVFVGENEEKTCKLLTGADCAIQEGVFNEGLLCSNPSLETECTKQNSTSCVIGKDEVYWIDSCGNRENIYEGSSQSQKDSSWHEGNLKKKEDSCVLGNVENPIAEQGSCGNCNPLAGNICGDKTDKEKLDDSAQNFVCRDRACVDEKGDRREHGESWCAYQSSIGLYGPDVPGIDGIIRGLVPNPLEELTGTTRGTDTPGSSHFRQVCLNGEITPQTCDPGRAEICVEHRTPVEGSNKVIAAASCKENRAIECFNYNPTKLEGQAIGLAGPEKAWRILKTKLDLTCGVDPDCFVKNVFLEGGIGLGGSSVDTFKFAFCVPRYKPGFDRENTESAKLICAQASQKCTAVFVKHLSGWKCEANCHCIQGEDPESTKPNQKFVNGMNDFCVSLGDCGSSLSYVGGVPGGKGYSVTKAKKDSGLLGQFLPDLQFNGGFENLIGVGLNPLEPNALDDEYIEANYTLIDDATGGLNKFFEENGIFSIFREIDAQLAQLGGRDFGGPKIPDGYTDGVGDIALISGGAGVAMLGGAWALGVPLSTPVLATTPIGAVAVGTAPTAIVGFSGALAGAGIGLAATGFLIDVLGVGAGLGRGLTYSFMAGGAVSGAMIGVGLAQSATSSATLGTSFAPGTIGFAGIMIAVVIIIILLIFKFLGVGEVQEIDIVFECKPWVAPIGGSREICGSCGEDKLSDGSESFPCNEYACEALGLDCVLAEESEGVKGGICEYAPRDDVSAPIVESVDVLSTEFSVEEASENEFVIRRDGATGERQCLSSYESVTFTINLDEYGEDCRISAVPTENFDEMAPIGSGRNLTYTFSSQLLEGLGFDGDLEEERINEVNLFIACKNLRQIVNPSAAQIVNLCVSPEDWTAPKINILGGDQILRFGATEKEVTIQTSEPAECKWDVVDGTYERLRNDVNCINQKCQIELPVNADETTLYVKCLDRPEWIGTDREDERNGNIESEIAIFRRSASVLAISSLVPDIETFVFGNARGSIEVIAETSGGADGSATCMYSLNNGTEIIMKETGGKKHKQIISDGSAALSAGSHQLKIDCEDIAGNEANRSSTFNIEIDSGYPEIVRTYIESGRLYIVTNEEAECAFVNQLRESGRYCDFSVDDESGDVVQMSIQDSKGSIHSTIIDSSLSYYVKCKDKYENLRGSQCNIVVREGI